MEKLGRLHRRLQRIGVDIEMAANYPWVYLRKVNGKSVKRTWWANHGFCIFFSTTGKFTDLRVIFKQIRKELEDG